MKDFTALVAPETRRTIRLDHQLREAISQIVPAAALASISLCRLENEQLHITLSSASWLSRLRFSEKAMLKELEKVNLTANGVRWHVLPGRVEPPERLRAAAVEFSDKNLRESLQAVAESMQRRLDEKQGN